MKTQMNKIALQIAPIAVASLSFAEMNSILVRLDSKAAKSKKAAQAALMALIQSSKAHFSTYFYIRTPHRDDGSGQDTVFMAKHRTHREDIHHYVMPASAPAPQVTAQMAMSNALAKSTEDGGE